MNAGLDQNEMELGVLVLSILLEVLAHGDGLLDEVVEVLRQIGAHTSELQQTQDLVTSDALDLGDTHAVTESDTDLRGGHTLLSQLADLLNDVLRSHLDPRSGLALVRQSGAAHTLTLAVHATHGICLARKEKSKQTSGH